MSRTITARRTSNRVMAVAITILIAVIANIAISYAAGISTYTIPPRPIVQTSTSHAGISTTTEPPRPVVTSATQHAGISTTTEPPRPVSQHAGISTYTIPPRP